MDSCYDTTPQVEFVVAFLGATYARCVAAPLNSAYKPDEFEFYMDDAKSKLLIVPPEGNAAAQRAAAKLRVPVLTLRITWSKGMQGLCTYQKRATHIFIRRLCRGAGGQERPPPPLPARRPAGNPAPPL